MKITDMSDLTGLLLDYYKKKLDWVTKQKYNHGEYLERLVEKYSDTVSEKGLSSYRIREYEEEVTFIRDMYEYLKKLEDYFLTKISELEKTGYSSPKKQEPVN